MKRFERYLLISFPLPVNSFPGRHLPRIFPLPSRGYTTFYFITKSGVLFSTAKESDLENSRSPLSPLFTKAHEVITQARTVDEKRTMDLQELMRAVTTGNEVRTGELLSALPTPDISDPTGLTPLMAAAYSGHARIVQMSWTADLQLTGKIQRGTRRSCLPAMPGNLRV